MKVVDTETGEIVDARTIEATAKGKALSAGLSIRNFSLDGGGYEKTPAGKAIRACIVYIAEYLECSMVKGEDDDCMEEWDERTASARKRPRMPSIWTIDPGRNAAQIIRTLRVRI